MTQSRSLIPLVRNSPRLAISEIPLKQIKLNKHSPRKHPEKQIARLARMIDQVGFIIPVVADEENRVISGNARVIAADRLGLQTIPVIKVTHLTEDEKRAFIIGDNKLVA